MTWASISPFHQFLHFEDPTCLISAACPGGLGGTRWLVHEHSRRLRAAPSSCICGCTRPTAWGSVASGNAASSQESVRPPIPPNHRLFLDMVPRMVVLRQAGCSDRGVTHGWLCDSALFSASLVCKHTYWQFYLPYTVQWFGSVESRATRCSRLRRPRPFRQRILIAVPGLPTSSPGEAGESLPYLISLRPPVFPTSYSMGLWVAWTALAGGCGSWPRMASSALSDGLNCCKQTLPRVTVLPSDPARSWRRLVRTVPWSGFAIPSGHRFGDGRRSTACG